MSRFGRFLQNSSFRQLALVVGSGLVLTLILQNFELSLLEAHLFDFRTKLRERTTQSSDYRPQTVLVMIDDKTVDALSEYSPLSLKQHVRLLETISRSQPKGVAYFLNFADALRSDATSDDSKFADQFVRTADAMYAAGTPVYLGTDVDVTGEVVPPFPLSKLPHRVSTIHKDGAGFSEDKVTRRALFSIYDEPVLHVQLASLVNGKFSSADYRGVYPLPDLDAKYFLIHFQGSTMDAAHPFPEFSAIDLLEGRVSPDALRGKLVLIGSKTKEDSSDYAYTPFSRELFTNPKLVIHANIIETLIRNDAIVKAGRGIDILLTFLLTCLVIAMVFRTSPASGVVYTSLLAIVLIGAATLFFRSGLWLCLSHPLLGIFFAYYIFVPYRLIMEYKQRWQFQKKHEVLVQVEELKSNFMSLITHDLKTPVARIQGLAEILARSNADPKIVGEILSSTEELNRFITGILELAKIESNRITLDQQSKDINKVIEDCVQKFTFQAKQKNISIETDLEPLFPIWIDSPLITKVVSNLIDNALKYSEPGARIALETRESTDKPGFVEVTITDTGPGIATKDLENLFSKFYRPQNDITLRTKGTGLGLYLSRYFVELHKGSLTVESVVGKGTMFTILLPAGEAPTTNAPSSSTHAEGEKAYV